LPAGDSEGFWNSLLWVSGWTKTEAKPPAAPDREATPCNDGVEANMTVANMIEIVVVLAILYVAYRFFQKRG
jgi:hypothetical protein